MKTAVIGLGNLGSKVAANLVAAGPRVWYRQPLVKSRSNRTIFESGALCCG